MTIEDGYADACDKFVDWDDNGKNARNGVRNSRFHGTPTSGRAVDIDGDGAFVDGCWFEDGNCFTQITATNERVTNSRFPDDLVSGILDRTIRGHYRGIDSTSRTGAQDEDRQLYFTEITSTSSANVFTSQDYAAGELKPGDIIHYEFGGTTTGTGGTKNVEIYVGGTQAFDIQFAAGETGDYHVVGSIRVQSTTTVVFGFSVESGAAATATAQVGGAVVSDLSANSLTIETRAWKGVISDILRVRFFSALLQRIGM